MYASVRRYEGVDRESADEMFRKVEESFVPIAGQSPGFIAYYALDAGDGVVASVTLFEDQAGLEESNRRAADYVGEHLAGLLPPGPQVTAGEVKVSKTG